MIVEHLKPNSAIGSHISKCNQCNSQNYVNSFKAIDKAQTDFDLQILKALHITDNRPQLNKQLGNDGSSFKLKIFYATVLVNSKPLNYFILFF